MSLNPDPWLAEQLLGRWCPEGKEVVVVMRRQTGAAHVYTELPGTRVMLPITVQVADLLERYLDRDGAVRLERRESADQLVRRLALRLHGRPDALHLNTPAPTPAPRPPRRPRRTP